MIEKLISEIKKAEKIAIISHISPDGDTCGSSLALFRALQKLGKNVQIFCEDEIISNIALLKFREFYKRESDEIFDIAISVDCGDFGRLGKCQSIFLRAKITANIDHHQTNDGFADINLVEPHVSATAEVMYYIICELNKINECFDNDIAALLYTAIVTDSGGFTFSNVSTDTLRIASELIKYDINASKICEKFLKSISLDVFKLKNLTLSSAQFFENNKIGMIFFTNENFAKTNTNENYTTGIINAIRNVEGVELAVSMAQTSEPNFFKCSIRANDNVDAAKIANIFGGGGHKNASGFKVGGDFEDVKNRILKACVDALNALSI